MLRPLSPALETLALAFFLAGDPLENPAVFFIAGEETPTVFCKGAA